MSIRFYKKYFPPVRQNLLLSFAVASKKAITAQAIADVIIALLNGLILYKVFAEIYFYLFMVYAYLLIFDPGGVKHSFR